MIKCTRSPKAARRHRRGKGRSAVAAAAYRAAEKIANQYDGVMHDYTKKSGVVHAEILLPNHAPAEQNISLVREYVNQQIHHVTLGASTAD